MSSCHTIAIVSFVLGSLLLPASLHAQQVDEYEGTADLWLLDSGNAEATAFDLFYPGIEEKDYLSDSVAFIELDSTTIAITRPSGSGAIKDSSSLAEVSDAALYDQNTVGLMWDFSEPVYGFYTYYGSAGVANTFTMNLYYENTLVDTIQRFGGGLGIDAVGHGFQSNVPIDRIDFISTGPDLAVLVGAFVGLASGEPSLGTVHIDGYRGPNGSTIEYDFAVSTVPPVDYNLSVSDLYAGSDGVFTINNAQPHSDVYLAYSLLGMGETYVPQLNIAVNLSAPAQAGRVKTTNAAGSATWLLPIPMSTFGRDIWLQSAQDGMISNVVTRNIN